MNKKGIPLTQEEKNRRIKEGLLKYWSDPTRSGDHKLKMQEGLKRFWARVKKWILDYIFLY